MQNNDTAVEMSDNRLGEIVQQQFSVGEYLKKYYRDTSHAYEVRKLSLMLFDEVNAKIKKMPLKQRKILEIAALLHDIGYNVEAKSHNKHSYALICEHGVDELSEKQTVLAAHIARYHRGSLPDKSRHEDYSRLDGKERKIVKRLSAILRLCDGLDRAHLKLIKSLSADYDEANKIFSLCLESNIAQRTPDISYAIKKKDLFEKVFDVQVVFKFNQY